jgi:hypothetical protein
MSVKYLCLYFFTFKNASNLTHPESYSELTSFPVLTVLGIVISFAFAAATAIQLRRFKRDIRVIFCLSNFLKKKKISLIICLSTSKFI